MRIPPAIIKREPLFRRIVMALGVVALLGCAARAILKPYDGDFKLHWETGRRFLAGEFLYAGGHDFPYPPFFAMIFAPAALLPIPIAKVVFYPVGVAALLLLLWTMRRLVRSAFPLDPRQEFWTAALAVFLVIQFVIRDQAELGLNTAIVAFTWLGIYLWRRSRDLLAGVALGLTIAIKCIPVIFLGYFVWKRQWRMAICTAVATLFFTAAPVVWQGPGFWGNHMKTWIGNAIDGMSGSGFEANENFRDRNMSLRPVLLRYLTYPQEQGLDATAALPPVNVLDLSPSVARWIVNSIALGLLGVFIWWSHGPVASRVEPRVLWELAAVGILGLLFSPVTWAEHCVALLPACYLIAALLIARESCPRWIIALLLIYVFFCSVLGRDMLPQHLSLLILSYHVTTFCILGLFAIVLRSPHESLELTADDRVDHRRSRQ